MSFQKLLTHTCDIYHLRSKQKNSHYGVPAEDRQLESYYEDIPDSVKQSCYLVEKQQTMVQHGPNRTIIQQYAAQFPLSADIKINSKVIWEGLELKAQKPRTIRNHHQKVRLTREVNL